MTTQSIGYQAFSTARKPTLADNLSMVPGLQQVIGIGTVLSNSIKLVGDAAQLAFYNYKKDKLAPEAVGIGPRQFNVLIDDVHQHNEGTGGAANIVRSKIELKKMNDKINKVRENIKQHTAYLIIGLVNRFVPVWGSIYSGKVSFYGAPKAPARD
jgi:hypothetical protein